MLQTPIESLSPFARNKSAVTDNSSYGKKNCIAKETRRKETVTIRGAQYKKEEERKKY